jgi:hypothetical protein
MTALLAEAHSCGLCGASHYADGAYCGRCQPIVDDTDKARRKTPYVVVANSAFPPYQPRVLSGDDELWRARRHAAELAAAGYTGLHVEDERTGQRWAVSA